MKMKYKIQYIDGICGSGKTQKTIEYIIPNSYDNLFVIAQPTINLLEETLKRIKSIDPNVIVKIIHSNNSNNTVGDLLSAIKLGYGIILITHSSFFRLPADFPGKNTINLFIDEIPSITFNHSGTYPIHSTLWMKNYMVEESSIDNYYKLVLKPGALSDIKAQLSKKDDIVSVYADLFRFSTHWASYLECRAPQWNKLAHLSEEDSGQIEFYGYYKPSLLDEFASCSIMGANFNKSLLYKIYNQLNVKFVPHLHIKNLELEHSIERNKLVELKYFSDRNWSISTLNKLDKSNPFKDLIPSIASEFGGDQFIYTSNNKYGDNPINLPNAEKIPAIVHGRNDWMHINNCLFISALNSTPGTYEWINQKFGISGDEVAESHSYEIGYQTLMRTSLRNGSSTQPVKFIVGDKRTANYLAHSIFPGCKMSSINSGIKELGDPVKKRGAPIKSNKLSNTQRTTQLRQKIKEIMSTKNTLYKVLKVNNFNINFEKSITEDTIKESLDWVNFKEIIKDSWNIKYKTKEENFLLSGSDFDKNKSTETNKGLENILSSSMLILDFDNSPITNKEISDTLWDCNWILYNSWSNGKNLGRNFRVLIPFNSPIDPQYYGDIWDTIVHRFEVQGYYVKKHPRDQVPTHLIDSGIDKSKRPANSFFYMPSWPGSGKEIHHIWEEQWNRTYLDPYKILDKAVLKTETVETPVYINPKSSKLNQVIQQLKNEEPDPIILLNKKEKTIEKAKNRWRSAGEGSGNSEYFILFKTLKPHYNKIELEKIMKEELLYAKSPDDRKKQLKQLLKSK